MKRKRCSVEQIIGAKQQELGIPAGEFIPKLRIAEATLYRRNKRYGGLDLIQSRTLKQRRDENVQLVVAKRLYFR